MPSVESIIKKIFIDLDVDYEIKRLNNTIGFLFGVQVSDEILDAGIICDEFPEKDDTICYYFQIIIGQIGDVSINKYRAINNFNFENPFFKAYLNEKDELIIESNQCVNIMNLHDHLGDMFDSLLLKENDALDKLVENIKQ